MLGLSSMNLLVEGVFRWVVKLSGDEDRDDDAVDGDDTGHDDGDDRLHDELWKQPLVSRSVEQLKWTVEYYLDPTCSGT